jgi:vancomycin resistance protein VanJ
MARNSTQSLRPLRNADALSKGESLPLFYRLVWGVLWMGAIGLLLWNVFRVWPGERLWPVAAVNYALPWIGLGLIPLIALTWLFRQRALSLAFVAALFLIGVHLAPHFLLKPSPPPGGFPLRVMTFNVHQRNEHITSIVDAIVAEDPDVVALQELVPSVSERLAAALEERYPYHTLRSDQPVEGQGLLSRYPLEMVSVESAYRFQSAVVQTPGGRVTLLNIHTPSLFPIGWRKDWQRQREFVEELVAQIRGIEGPLLVVGDFNTTPQSENYRLMRRYLRDAFVDSGWGLGFSYPATPKFGIRLPWPLVRIDYIFYNDHLAPHETWVLKENGGSDHRPLVSVLRILDK